MKRKLSLILVALFVLSSLFVVTVIATDSDRPSETPKTHSTIMEAGDWWSGLDEGQLFSLYSNYSQVYGGDVHVNFYATDIGLPSGFSRDVERTAEIWLREEDEGANPNEDIQKIVAEFSVRPSGLYRLHQFYFYEPSHDVVEPNDVAEVYLICKVDYFSDVDSTANVPAGILYYKIYLEQ